MANLLVEIGNTALKAAWADGITLGKTFRYQGEKNLEFIESLTRKQKAEIMVVASSGVVSEAEEAVLREGCHKLLLLDRAHPETLKENDFPSYLSYDRAASLAACKYLFRGRGVTLIDFGTTISIDFLSESGTYEGGNLSVGCRTRFKALNRYSRSLPLVNTPETVDEMGTSIVSSIEAGVISGIEFEMRGYLEKYPDNILVFTGGDANYFAKRMKSSIFVVCNLVLMGLAIIAERHAV